MKESVRLPQWQQFVLERGVAVSTEPSPGPRKDKAHKSDALTTAGRAGNSPAVGPGITTWEPLGTVKRPCER
jgi:hypothetical protein